MKIKKLLKFIGAAAACLTFAAVGTIFASAVTCGDFEVTGDSNSYSYDSSKHVLTITDTGEVTISMASGVTQTTTDRIEVASGVNANITLNGVNIDNSSRGGAAFKIADNSTGNVTITLADGSTNALKSGDDHAGLQKNGDNGTLEIKGGTLGTGKLEAIGGDDGAGIGGGNGGSASNITISGGTVIATGCVGGAGIGGGSGRNASSITISGGVVTATTGGRGGTDIGAGNNGSTTNIVITGGSVKGGPHVQPTDGNGNNVYKFEVSSASSSLKIDGKDYPTNHETDGRVYVYLTEGYHILEEDGDTYALVFELLSGGVFYYGNVVFVVTATNSGETLTYGTDYTYENHVLTVSTTKAVTIKNTDPTTATTDRIEVADGVSANITLAGVNIDVSGTSCAAAFKIADNSTGNVTITLADGSTNVLKSGDDRAGLQKNGKSTSGTLTIKGGEAGTGKLEAIGGYYGAGIGGAKSTYGGNNITISGGTVIATGGSYGAGIGGGDCGSASNITISGGVVTATSGGSGGTDIGAGADRTTTNIIITGGSVKGEPHVQPTLDDKTTFVYLLEIENPDGGEININGVITYPTEHVSYVKGTKTTEKKIYAYLPAKTATDPNVVTVGAKTTNCYYDTGKGKWITVVKKPDILSQKEFTYNGNPQNIELDTTQSEYFTVSGNEGTNAGTYPVTVSLKDKDKTAWNDGTTTDLEYEFKILKAEATVDTPTAEDITYGQSLSESALTNGWSWVDGTVVPSAGYSQHYAVKTVTDDNNYDYSNSQANIIYNSNNHTIKWLTAIQVERAAPKVMLSVNGGKAMPGSKVTLGVSMDNIVLSDMPSYSSTYRVDNGAEEGFVDEFVIPADTPEGAWITVTVKTTKDLNYIQVEESMSFMVNACDHAVLVDEWQFTPTTHYKKCAYCEKAVDETNHTFDNDGNCTVCGYHDGAAIVTTTTAGTYPHYTGTRPNIVTTTTKATTTTTTTTTVEETTTTTAPPTTTAKKTTAAETTVKKPAETTATAKSDDSGVDGVSDAVSGDENPITGVTISFSAVILAGAVVMATKKKRK